MSVSHGSPKLRDALAKKLRILRQGRGITQEKLASLSRLHPTYISMLENGRKSPTVDVLERIAGALGMRVSTLVASAENSGEDSHTGGSPHGKAL